MNQISRSLRQLAVFSSLRCGSIHTSSLLSLKKIEITQDEKTKTITIEGKPLDSEKIFGSRALKLDDSNDSTANVRPCPFCLLEKRGIFVQYSDVLVLRQFLTQDGFILPMSVTGLCKKQHRKLVVLTKLAKQAGLILNLQPKLIDGTMPETDIRKRKAHLKWNTYFEDYEQMIRKTKYV